MRSIVRKAGLTTLCAVAAVGLSATAASAGEIKGNGGYIFGENGPLHGKSICAYSGQNDAFHDPTHAEYPGDELNRVQSFGQIVKVAGPLGGVPGQECNPTAPPPPPGS